MPRPDAAKTLADNWHNLAHPDGKPRRLMHFSNFGRHPSYQAPVTKLAGELGEAAIYTLEKAGYTITHHDDPKPLDAADHKAVHLTCARCNKTLATIGADADCIATLSRTALRALTAINPECPHD